MKKSLIKVLLGLGVSCDERDSVSSMITRLEEEFGITVCLLEKAPDLSTVVKEMSKDVEVEKCVFMKVEKDDKRRKWHVPKKIGKPQKKKC